MKQRILLVEDDAGSRFGFVRYFSKEGYEIREAETLAAAAEAVAAERFDALVLDMNLPDGNGIDFVETVRRSDPEVAIIVITGAGDIPVAVDAMRRGADNFLTKPFDSASLAVYLRKNLEVSALKRSQSASLRVQHKDAAVFGEAPGMADVLEFARVAAESNCAVLITGETGTGKGMLAKWIHRNSERASRELVEVNCSALQGDLLARELFGNLRGAFTSADKDRKGLLDVADRGTLFLDEMGDMGLSLQAQFLKVLEEKSYRRLGDVKLLKSDFRLICATNRDLDAMVREGTFRQDLVYRINLMTIHLPPLRERVEDVPQLAAHLLGTLDAPCRELSGEVLSLLCGYDWPGNIRELRNVLERALLLAQGGRLEPRHFLGLGKGATPAKPQLAAGVNVHQAVDAHVLAVVSELGGDVDAAAVRLGISRATIYRKLKKLKG